MVLTFDTKLIGNNFDKEFTVIKPIIFLTLASQI